MTEKQTDSKKLIYNLIAIFILIVSIITAFVFFYYGNVKRITRQNENYIADVASQRSALINDLFEENLSYIESAAIVLETEFINEGLNADRLNVENDDDLPIEDVNKVADILRLYEKRLAFDYLRYIDLRGRDYTTGDKIIAAVVADREYFKRGSMGESGMTYILDSKVTSQRQVGFFAPVYQNGELVGMTIGFYNEAFLEELLKTSLFGYECDVLLCADDQTIIYSRGSGQLKDLEAIHEAFEKKESTLYDFDDGFSSTVGYISYIGPSSDFFLILDFPVDAYQEMVQNASINGVMLMGSLVGIFACAGILYVINFFYQKKRLLEETKNSNDIHYAMSRLFENFVIVNADSGTYHYIEGMPVIGHIPNDGPYELFAEDLLSRFPNEKEKQEARKALSFEHLIKEMNEGADIISYNLHAPIYQKEWFTYNFIVVSRDEGNKVKEFIVAPQDISKLQEKEEETRRILQKARDEAEKGNRAKSDFLSSMSHDIRTPMNAIIGYTNIALDHLEDDAMVEDSLNKISSSGQYLLSLINDVLDMSRIESGKVQIKEAECDLRKIFDRVADLTCSQAEKKNLKVDYDIKGIIHPYVICDELRLEQILVNISGNAVKYTPQGGSIFIEAKEEKINEEENFYHFTIRDTGIGMSEDFLPHIFESFSRETNSTINKIQGTGLGMAITSRLVQMMDGKIEVFSKLNEGSKFVVSLKLKKWDKKDKQEAKEENNILNLNGKRILLVEDNDINAEIAGLVLSQFGILMDRACNGKEGYERILKMKEDYYDAVLMDIQMPQMNGYEATRAIRDLKGDYYQKIPIIAMSANAYEEDIRKSLQSGMNAHIAKPFDPKKLAEELNSLMEEKQ